MRNTKVLKRIIIILLGVLTLPMFVKFEDVFDVGDYVIASSIVLYAIIMCLLVNGIIWGIPSFRLTLWLSIICNSGTYAYMMYKKNK